MSQPLKPILFCAIAFLVAACTQQELFDGTFDSPARVTEVTRSTLLLRSLPAPQEKIAVAVYSFDDQTGQYKESDKITQYSSAVTKGGLAILNNALLDAGNKRWFTVIERGGLKNVLQERQIIRAMREQYRMPDGQQLPDVPPLLYAGMIIEGGIISYDTNMVTGGLAARYFGFGGTSEYRKDTVSVYLRAVNIQTGEVLLSVTSTKTLFSASLQGNIFKYMTPSRILEAETGITMNEPGQFAVRQAIETAVYALVMEGTVQKMWGFADPRAGQKAMADYLERKSEDGDVSEMATAQAAMQQKLREDAAPAPRPVPQAPVAAVPVAPAAPTESAAPPAMPPAPEAVIREPLPKENLPKEPLPKLETKASEPQKTQPGIVRPADPGAIVRYLDDSRYNQRGNGSRPAPKLCEVDPATGECKK